MKLISNRERNRRKYKKMLISLSNKLTESDMIWWDSLSQKAQYSLLFKYIREKSSDIGSRKSKFKYFLNKYRSSFKPSIRNMRNASIEYLINK